MNENINKVIYGTSTLIDLTEDTVSPDRMYKGDIAHDASGAEITGTAEITVDGTTLIMPEGLCNLIGTVDPETNHWVRPDYLPDLSSVYNGEANTLWMTVDATGRIPDPHVCIVMSGDYTVQVGTIENGVFVPESTDSRLSGTTWTKEWTPTEGLYPVLKFTCSGDLTYYQFRTWTSAEGRYYSGAQYQSIIEIQGHIARLHGDMRTPHFTEYEKIKVDSIISDSAIAYRWQNAHYLQELDLSDWDTSTWHITSLACTWQYCRSLETITGIEDIDTSNWEVGQFSNTWHWCTKLKKLDLHKWDVSNWKVDNMASPWCNCFSLELLDVSTWDTSNWVVWHMGNTWTACRELRYLPISSWKTHKWAVTNLSSTWQNLYLLKTLDLSGWDTENWAVTQMQYTWQGCRQLAGLDISTWDTSGWNISSLQYTWESCHSLQKLNLNNWDTNNWSVTNMSHTWNLCYELSELDISDWDVSNWEVTNISNTWYQCVHLQDLDLSSWDVSNWKVQDASNTFRNMYTVKNIDIHTWDTSEWTFTANSNYSPMYGYNILLKSIDYGCFDLSKFYIHCTSSGNNAWDNETLLQNLTFGQNNNGKLDATEARPLIRLDWSPLLTPQSILNIFNALKSGVSGKTLQLGSQNLNKMTAEEKAIATNKGWTLT